MIQMSVVISASKRKINVNCKSMISRVDYAIVHYVCHKSEFLVWSSYLGLPVYKHYYYNDTLLAFVYKTVNDNRIKCNVNKINIDLVYRYFAVLLDYIWLPPPRFNAEYVDNLQ